MAGISKWYVVHTYSGYENKVMDNIQKVVENRKMQDLILDVRVPTEIVEELKESGEVKQVERKVFPGYVLVKLAVEEHEGTYSMDDDAWYVIRNTRGCTGFVGPESKPVPLSEAEVKRLGVETGETAVSHTMDLGYAVGDYVRVIGGSMEGFEGVVQNIDPEAGRVTVKVSIFGRENDVEVELNQVEPSVE